MEIWNLGTKHKHRGGAKKKQMEKNLQTKLLEDYESHKAQKK